MCVYDFLYSWNNIYLNISISIYCACPELYYYLLLFRLSVFNEKVSGLYPFLSGIKAYFKHKLLYGCDGILFLLLEHISPDLRFKLKKDTVASWVTGVLFWLVICPNSQRPGWWKPFNLSQAPFHLEKLHQNLQQDFLAGILWFPWNWSLNTFTGRQRCDTWTDSVCWRQIMSLFMFDTFACLMGGV